MGKGPPKAAGVAYHCFVVGKLLVLAASRRQGLGEMVQGQLEWSKVSDH